MLSLHKFFLTIYQNNYLYEIFKNNLFITS